MIKAIITDFDGTLVDTFEANYKSYKKVFYDVANYDLTEEFYRKSFGLRIDDICKKINIVDKNIINEIKNQKVKAYINNLQFIKLNQSLFNTLQYFKSQGLKIVLATTASKMNLMNVLKYLDLESLFDIIISGDDVKYGKPDPEVYNVALDKLNMLGDQVLVFEDSNVGIEAASYITNNIIKINSF